MSASRRFADADAASHSRALGYLLFLLVISGFVGIVGLASQLHIPVVRMTVERFATRISPGPSGRLLRAAAAQGAQGGLTAMLAGLGAALITAIVAMVQVQRSAERIFGSRGERPMVQRLVSSLGLTVAAGVPLVAGFLLIGAGETIRDVAGWSGGGEFVFEVVRWTIGPLLVLLGTWVIFRWGPRDRPSSVKDSFAGVIVTVVLWIVFTFALALDLSTSTSARTYGSLLAVVGLIVWAGLAALALHLGLVVCAELDDRR